jgi:two-component system, chemotaxis family, sensor kinase CheA
MGAAPATVAASSVEKPAPAPIEESFAKPVFAAPIEKEIEKAAAPEIAAAAPPPPAAKSNTGTASMTEKKPEPTETKAAHEPEPQPAGAETTAGSTAGAARPASSDPADSSIRVNVALLDKLMNLMGEMVLVRNQVIQQANKSEDMSFIALSQRLDVVTNELQDQVMRTRMQPIGNVLGNFQRLVRELAKDLSKRIDLTVQGKDTELDKTLLEAIKDPLTHIVRNSCDHGIESPQDRKKAGKPETGHVLVSAFHEGGQVTVEISDDGRGLNQEKILKKALEKSLITQEKAAQMTEREVQQLIFLPGFSTADQVSAISGRGVGMDVVKTNVERIGGTVELSSVTGRGSTIRLKVPLTLAIVPIMLVRAGEDNFAIPQVNLVELVRAGRANQHAPIELLQGQPVLRLRGNLMPLVELSTLLQDGGAGGLATRELAEKEIVNVVVVKAEGQPFGIVVDEVSDTADIVVKPLSKFLKALELYSGATILGNGNVALILDILGMAKKCHIASQKREEMDFQTHTEQKSGNEVMEYLVFRLRNAGNYCVPLCLVHRLEEFPKEKIEITGKNRVVQYRDSILPLLDLNSSLGYGQKNETSGNNFSSVIVMKKGGRVFGIEVEEILDIILSDTLHEDPTTESEGTLGNILQDGQLYLVVDALALIDRDFFGIKSRSKDPYAAVASVEETVKKTIPVLYVEDVAFFRKQVGTVLEKAGFNVTTAPDGQSALDILKGRKDFRLILSDIEMPKMDGYAFARAVRKQADLNGTPLLALTTRFHKRDIEEGKAAGFDGYLEKLNPEKLLAEIQHLLSPAEKEIKHGNG